MHQSNQKPNPQALMNVNPNAEPAKADADTHTGHGCMGHQQISERAHRMWEQNGRPCNQAVETWLKAEAQLRHECKNS